MKLRERIAVLAETPALFIIGLWLVGGPFVADALRARVRRPRGGYRANLRVMDQVALGSREADR